MAESLTGVLERIIFLNEETHYTIAELRPELPPREGSPASRRPGEGRRVVTILGSLPGVECGETLHLTGEWTRHVDHGDQFKIAGFKSELPASVHGIRKYLGSGLVPGIGPVYAEKIVDAFGEQTFRILSEESGKLRGVPGIGKKRATAIKQAWDEKRAEREIYIFLQTYGVTPAQCVRIVRKYGVQSAAILRAEPYRIAREIDGIGFKTADRIAINLGFANDAAPRLDAGLIYALETLQEEGHAAFPESDLRDYAAGMLESTREFIAARLEAMVANGDLVRNVGRPLADAGPDPLGRPQADALPAGEPLIQLPAVDRAERRIASTVARLAAVSSGLPPIKVDAAVAWAEKQAGFEFHDLQRRGLQSALTSKLSILTGGPGTGKTTILRALVEILRAKKARVHLAAPTGRAAQRLSDAARAPASTIHRLLKYDPAGGFLVNESSPLATDFLIVDEASMLDTRLAGALLQAVPSRAHLLLVGDTDQLPSVGAGDILKDLIASEKAGHVAVTRLSVIYRQQGQSAIVTTAHAVNAGNASVPVAAGGPEPVERALVDDLTFIPANSAADCVDQVLSLCTDFIPTRLRWPHPIRDVQVLAPMHKGEAGVANFNVRLQAALNPAGARGLKAGAEEFRPGDKIIQLRNNYDQGLFNGDIGTVIAVDPAKGALTAEFDRQRHDLERGEVRDLALAYCISIHKSQGSEYPVVIIPLLKAHFMMLQRNLLYTAITRGKRKVFLVGDPAAYAMAVRNIEAKQRITDLRRKIAAGD